MNMLMNGINNQGVDQTMIETKIQFTRFKL